MRYLANFWDEVLHEIIDDLNKTSVAGQNLPIGRGWSNLSFDEQLSL